LSSKILFNIYQIFHSGGQNIYTIQEIANFLSVQPKTIRVLERFLSPTSLRRNGDILYSPEDLKRLSFIQELLSKGFNLDLLQDYLAFYLCWLSDDCPECMSTPKREGCAKRCWKKKGTFCQVSLEQQDMCKRCNFNKGRASILTPLSWRTK
jgi:MerR family transcriptional regulator/heat shock protein HspR